MIFGGNKYAYISKNKVDNIATLKKFNSIDIINPINTNNNTYNNNTNNNSNNNTNNNTNNTNNIINIDDVSLFTVKKDNKPELKRENSVEKIKDNELDIIYSDEEGELEESFNSKNNLKSECKVSTSSISPTKSKNISKTIGNAKKFSSSKISPTIKENFNSLFDFSDEVVKNSNNGIQSNYNNNNNNNNNYDICSKLNSQNVEYNLEVDCNVIKIQFDDLKEKMEHATGDPYICKGCEAILNKYSYLWPISNSDKYTWDCEFCGYKNELMIEPEEIPETICVEYFIYSKNMCDKNFINTNSSYNYDDKVIFTFDTSGSMCVTEPVIGNHVFKANSKLEEENNELRKSFGENSNQFYGKLNKNVTYVSRLQCLQSAIEKNLESMKKLTPNVKVGFVQFSNEIIGIGDGTKTPVKINGNNLNDYEYIKKTGEDYQNIISKPIKDSSDFLLKHLYSIEESGQTSLGPAILFSINLLQNAKGSKIIICTDGLANIGLGCLDSIKNQEEHQKIKEFYYDLGCVAKQKGIIVSLITFEGEESKIQILSALVEQTGGTIARVKPSEMLDEISSLLSTEVIATDVKLKLRIHKAMSFRNENLLKISELSNNESTLSRSIGNATSDTEVYTEFHFKSSESISQLKDIKFETIKNVPFQCSIEYTTKKGDKKLRVITKKLEIVSDKKIIENQANFSIVALNAIEKCQIIAKEGKFRIAQAHANAWKKLLKRGTENLSNLEAYNGYKLFKENMNSFNNNLLAMQKKQIEKGNVKAKIQANYEYVYNVYDMEDAEFNTTSPADTSLRNRKRKKDLRVKLNNVKEKEDIHKMDG